jgi:hypothetical protein
MKCVICNDREATLDKWCEPCIKEKISIRIGERWKEIERRMTS